MKRHTITRFEWRAQCKDLTAAVLTAGFAKQRCAILLANPAVQVSILALGVLQEVLEKPNTMIAGLQLLVSIVSGATPRPAPFIHLLV